MTGAHYTGIGCLKNESRAQRIIHQPNGTDYRFWCHHLSPSIRQWVKFSFRYANNSKQYSSLYDLKFFSLETQHLDPYTLFLGTYFLIVVNFFCSSSLCVYVHTFVYVFFFYKTEFIFPNCSIEYSEHLATLLTS